MSDAEEEPEALRLSTFSTVGWGKDGATHLAGLLRGCGGLTALPIRRNNIGDAGAIQLIKALMRNK